MGFELLNNVYLKMGQLLAITPPSIQTSKNTRIRQIHQVFMILLTITCVTVLVCFRDFYLQYNLAKLTVSSYRHYIIHILLSTGCRSI